MGGIFTGPVAVMRALGLMAANPRLIVYAFVPAVVAFAISVLGGYLGVAYGDQWLNGLWGQPDGGAMGVVWTVASILSKLASVLLVLILTPWLVMLLGLPLCEPLAAHADAILGGRTVEGGGLPAFVRDVVSSIISTFGIIAIGLAGTVVFLVLGFIPGVAAITAPFVALIWTPLFLAFDLFDSGLARRRLAFGQKLGVIGRNLPAALSLGITATPLVAVPFLNLLGLPIVVVAGVIAVVEAEKRGSLV